MKKIFQDILRPIVALSVVAALSGCVTPGAAKAPREAAVDAPAPAHKPFPMVTIDTGEGVTMGQVIRRIGENSGGGAVLLAGLEDRPAPALKFEGTAFVPAMEQLASAGGYKLQVTPAYVFIYPPGYEQLNALSIRQQLHPRFQSLAASCAVGAGTDLYSAIALLATSLDITIVADNLVAGAWCGELFMDDAPLPEILDGILKASLVAPGSISIESTKNYIFLRSTQNANTMPSCLNAQNLSKSDQERLRRPVSLRLPRDSESVVFEPDATPFAAVREALSRQIGLPITIDPAMADLPINATVLNDVPLETALDLIVWQWPLPDMGYRMVDGAIQFTLRQR